VGGLILDNIVVFLFRVFTTLIGEYRSRDWPQAKGILTNSHSDDSYGYPLAEVTYSYTVDGECYSGLYKKGFWYRDSAVRFAKRVAPQTVLVVRYRLGAPSVSFLRKEDQVALNA
jgi:hypothetical protein